MLFKILQGNETNLPALLTDGYCYFLKDKHYFYVDHKNASGQLVRSKLSAEYADKLRYVNGGTMVEIAPEELALKSEVAAKADKATTLAGYGITDAYTINEIDNLEFITADDIDCICLIFDPVFANNSWKRIIRACQNNAIPDTWAVGDQKAMTINGTDYTIDIIGKNHDTYTSGGTAPLTFQLHDCYAETAPMTTSNSNSGGYDSSVMHTGRLPYILRSMPVEVQNAITPVNKKSGKGGGSSSGVETVPCRLFLLSEVEVFGTNTNSVSGEGTQYEYYKDGNSKIKYLGGSVQAWWERSPKSGVSSSYCQVSSTGGSTSYNCGIERVDGVSFAFCF